MSEKVGLYFDVTMFGTFDLDDLPNDPEKRRSLRDRFVEYFEKNPEMLKNLIYCDVAGVTII